MLEKLTRGVLHVSGTDGLRYVDLKFSERLRLLWLFRNFRILSQGVLPPHQRNWTAVLSENGRARRYASVLDREMAAVIGTLVTSEPLVRAAHEERRRAARLPLRFPVRYGAISIRGSSAQREPGLEMIDAEGCDISETGLAFIGPRAFPPGTEITIHFRLSPHASHSWTRTRAIIRNLDQKPGASRMGVEFTIIHPRDRAELRQLTVPKAAD